MRKMLLTLLASLAWLLASPSLPLRESGWVEVGAVPATAEEFTGIMVSEPGAAVSKSSKKKTAKKHRSTRIGSSGAVTSNQPGKYPMQPVTVPPQPNIISTVTDAPRDPRYPNVPTVPIVPRGSTAGAGIETSQDRVVRCTHQGALGGLSAGQQGAYVGNCAF